MALIAIAADKGAPGVTTAAVALAAVWPRPVLLAECDPAGGDLIYRFPAITGESLDPRRGLLTLAVAARRGGPPDQVWEHTQKLHGGLDVLTGVTNAEQGSGLHLLWGPLGKLLASLSQADVIADCGRIGADGPNYDLLAEATELVLVTRSSFGEVIRLRDRAASVMAAFEKRGRRGFRPSVLVRADFKDLRNAVGEVNQVVATTGAATVLGGIADDPRAAAGLAGQWGGKLDKTMLMRSAREVVRHLVASLPGLEEPAARYEPDGQYEGTHAAQPAPYAPELRGPDVRVQDGHGQDPRVQDPRVQDPRGHDPRVQDPRAPYAGQTPQQDWRTGR
jgi:MinD-like ATPase involved in chromosome partitioning or flagellar assembly